MIFLSTPLTGARTKPRSAALLLPLHMMVVSKVTAGRSQQAPYHQWNQFNSRIKTVNACAFDQLTQAFWDVYAVMLHV